MVQHLIRGRVAVVSDATPAHSRQVAVPDLGEERQQTPQRFAAHGVYILRSKKQEDGGAENAVVDVVLRELVELARQPLLALHPQPDAARDVNLASDRSQALAVGDIVAVQPAFELKRDALEQNLSKKVQDIVEVFAGDILIIIAAQVLKGIRQHIIYVADYDSGLRDHIKTLRNFVTAASRRASLSNQYSLTSGMRSNSTMEAMRSSSKSPSPIR